MKQLIIGIILGTIVGAGLVFYITARDETIALGHDVSIRDIGDEYGEEIEVFRGEERLISLDITSNAFYLRVPSDYIYPETLLFSEIQQEGKKIQKLVSSRKTPEGRTKTVQYDMETGDLEMIFLSTPDGEIEVLDKDGNTIDINQSEQGASHNERKRPS